MAGGVVHDHGHCHQCREHRSPLIDGQIYCTFDGRTIQDHVAAGDCPLKKFGSPATVQIALPPARSATIDIPLPGDAIAKLAKLLGADRLAKLWERWTGKPCGCKERQQKINRAAERLLRFLRLTRSDRTRPSAAQAINSAHLP